MNPERYSRQILFSGIGKEGQQRLAQSCAVVIGCGALGAMHAEMLARAGVGRLRLIDRDFIEESNLHRQIMFEERDVADRLPKAVAAACVCCHSRSLPGNAAFHSTATRTAWYCSGCPHNSSTKAPEGSIVSAGIGCHTMAMWMGRNVVMGTHMGAEGAQWIDDAARRVATEGDELAVQSG